MATNHKWSFKTKFRARALSWRGSKTAITHLKAAVSEIKKVAKLDPLTAGEGVVVLAERIWPAFENVDTSSGALGNAINKTLDTLIPVLIAAPADLKTRGNWLERLYEAVQDDGVQYLYPVEERWGEIAVYPELMNDYADRLMFMIRRVWSEDAPGGYVRGETICLASLFGVGRYSELLDLLSHARTRFWSDHRFGAKALARQGLYDAAIAYADGCRDPNIRGYDNLRINGFCEDVLIKAGRVDEAYSRFGLTTASGTTFISVYRETVRRYPSRDKRQVLLDLIATRGQKGKWFAAAKDAGFLDIALECASSTDAEPSTLIRAARDFTGGEPQFAANAALLALRGLLAVHGYDPGPEYVRSAFRHLMAAAASIGEERWAIKQVEMLANGPCSADRQHLRTALAAILAEGDDPNQTWGPDDVHGY